MSILLDDLTCNGTESSLLMCSSSSSNVVVPFLNDCSHDEDAGVVCNSKNSYIYDIDFLHQVNCSV